MKIKCPLCDFTDFDYGRYSKPEWAIEHHITDEHEEFIHGEYARLYFKIHEKIEELEQQNEDDAFCESGDNLSGQVGLLKSLIE